MRRSILFAAAPACVLLGIVPVAARADLAPTGSSSASALQAGEVAGVSTTGASAAPATTTAKASVVEVGGKPALGLGGTQTGDGQNSGALLDTKSALPARVEVAPWQASVSGAAGPERKAKASAAAARADVPRVAKVGVLQSQSEASHRSERSVGSGSSDALDLGLLDVLRIVLLHSEVSSEGRGSSYLASVNGTEIGSDEQLGSVCALDASPLLAASCLTATGGVGSGGLTSGAAELASAESALLPLSPLAAFAVRADSGPGASPLVSAAPVPAGAEGSRTQPAAAAAAQVAGEAVKRLARTGTPAAVLSGLALLALVCGTALRLTGRRRHAMT
jgi:hypothetical protein